MNFRPLPLSLSGIAALLFAACSVSGSGATPTLAPVAVTTQVAPSRAPDLSTPLATSSTETGDGLTWSLAPNGNEARYRVHEQLVELTLPGDAVGVTSAISGQIVLQADGGVVREESKFVVDLTTLHSDKSRRDGFIQRNTLNTSAFPLAEFVPTQAIGLPSPLPTSGEVAFQLLGELTVHGVTREATWDVTAFVNGQDLVGSAKTTITFADFDMQIPRVPVVLSVEEIIGLEFDFHLVAEF